MPCAPKSKPGLLAHYVLKQLDQLDEAQERKLSTALPADDPQATIEHIKEGLEEGRTVLLDVENHEGEKLGFTVYEVIETSTGKEFLSIASMARDARNMTQDFIPYFEQIARNNDCSTLRLHTKRAGLARQLLAMDWEVSEVVMRKKL